MPNKILKGTGSKENDSPGTFKGNDAVPSWFKGSDLAGGDEVVITASNTSLEGKKQYGNVSGLKRGSNPNEALQMKQNESFASTRQSRKTGKDVTTRVTAKEDTQKSRIPGRSYTDFKRGKEYTTSTPIKVETMTTQKYKA